jgi:hypothetical protein
MNLVVGPAMTLQEERERAFAKEQIEAQRELLRSLRSPTF